MALIRCPADHADTPAADLAVRRFAELLDHLDVPYAVAPWQFDLVARVDRDRRPSIYVLAAAGTGLSLNLDADGMPYHVVLVRRKQRWSARYQRDHCLVCAALRSGLIDGGAATNPPGWDS